MAKIRPVSDLINNEAETPHQVHETNEPVFLTKDMMVLNMQEYENMQLQSEVYVKLREAELYANTIGNAHSPEEVLKELKKVIE